MAIAIQLLAVAIDIGASLGEYQGFTVLALLCIAWIVAGFAAIELTCLPGGLVSSYEDERWRKWFRYCAVAYGGMPLLWGITDGGWALGDGVAIWYILTGALAVATALALFQHLSKLADRAEAGWLAATLELLGLAYVPAMALWALEFSSENGRGGDNSYNLMITLPLPVQGPATFSRELVGGAFSAWQQTSMSTTFLLLALIWLITPALLIWFILAIWRNVRNAAKDCEIPPNSDARQRSNRPDFR